MLPAARVSAERQSISRTGSSNGLRLPFLLSAPARAIGEALAKGHNRLKEINLSDNVLCGRYLSDKASPSACLWRPNHHRVLAVTDTSFLQPLPAFPP